MERHWEDIMVALAVGQEGVELQEQVLVVTLWEQNLHLGILARVLVQDVRWEARYG